MAVLADLRHMASLAAECRGSDGERGAREAHVQVSAILDGGIRCLIDFLL